MNALLHPREIVIIDHDRNGLAEAVKGGYLAIGVNPLYGFTVSLLESVEPPESYYPIPPLQPVLHVASSSSSLSLRRPHDTQSDHAISKFGEISPQRQKVDDGSWKALIPQRESPSRSASFAVSYRAHKTLQSPERVN